MKGLSPLVVLAAAVLVAACSDVSHRVGIEDTSGAQNLTISAESTTVPPGRLDHDPVSGDRQGRAAGEGRHGGRRHEPEARAGRVHEALDPRWRRGGDHLSRPVFIGSGSDSGQGRPGEGDPEPDDRRAAATSAASRRSAATERERKLGRPTIRAQATALPGAGRRFAPGSGVLPEL